MNCQLISTFYLKEFQKTLKRNNMLKYISQKKTRKCYFGLVETKGILEYN